MATAKTKTRKPTKRIKKTDQTELRFKCVCMVSEREKETNRGDVVLFRPLGTDVTVNFGRKSPFAWLKKTFKAGTTSRETVIGSTGTYPYKYSCEDCPPRPQAMDEAVWHVL